MGIQINTLRRTQQVLSFSKGERIFSQGEAGNHMYVITSGTVTISVDGRQITTLGPGEVLGEMALIDAAPRSAAATAASDCTLAPIDRARFMHLIQETPFFALQVMQTLAQRLRDERQREAIAAD